MRWILLRRVSLIATILIAAFALQAEAKTSTKAKKSKKKAHRQIAAESKPPKSRYKLQTYYVNGKVHHRYIDTRPEKAKTQTFEGSDAGLIMQESLPDTSDKDISANSKKKKNLKRRPESYGESDINSEVDSDIAKELDAE